MFWNFVIVCCFELLLAGPITYHFEYDPIFLQMSTLMFYWIFYDLVNLLELSFLRNVPNFKWNFSTFCFSFGRQSNFGKNRFKHPKYGTYFWAIHGEFSSGLLSFIATFLFCLPLWFERWGPSIRYKPSFDPAGGSGAFIRPVSVFPQ